MDSNIHEEDLEKVDFSEDKIEDLKFARECFGDTAFKIQRGTWSPVRTVIDINKEDNGVYSVTLSRGVFPYNTLEELKNKFIFYMKKPNKQFDELFDEAIENSNVKQAILKPPRMATRNTLTAQWIINAIRKAAFEDKTGLILHPKGNVVIISEKELKKLIGEKKKVQPIIHDEAFL